MGLNKREIIVIAETNRDNYSIEIKINKDNLWQAYIRLTQPEKIYEIDTSRGDLKTWRNLADAIIFFEETCNDCKDVVITTGEWKFKRI